MRFSELIVPGAEDLITVRDPHDLSDTSCMSDRLPKDLDVVRYRLRDRSLLEVDFAEPITTHSRLNAGDLHLTRIVDRFETEMEIGGDGLPRYWFGLVNAGALQVCQGTHVAVASGTSGLALQGLPGTGALSSDDSVRTNLWIEADALELTLAAMLDEDLKGAITFRPVVDWSVGLAGSLLGLMDYLVADAQRVGGLVTNEVAFASFNDMVLRTILLGLPHDRSERLTDLAGAALPHPIRRAEEFMRAHADRPLRMTEIAAAAGCSLRTLEATFERVRGETPLAALRAIRLDKVREVLQRGAGESVGDVARRFGFTNAGRFAAAYARRFGEHPSDTIRLRLRGR